MENGFSVVICGGKEDYEGGERLAHNLTQTALQKGLDTKALSLCGSTSLSALARVVYNGNHLLSNETSCVHIACAIRHDISIYVVSNGNHLYRFTPYPQGIGGKYYGIYHPTIDKNLAAYGIISNFLQEASRLDINHISPQAVIRVIESTLASEVSESILLIGGGAAQKLNSKNSSLAQSLNDFCGSARSLTPSKLPSPRLEKHLNLAQDTRIFGKPSIKFNANLESKLANLNLSPFQNLPYHRILARLDSRHSKIFDEKCGLQEKVRGSYLGGNDRSTFSPLPHLSRKAECLVLDCEVA